MTREQAMGRILAVVAAIPSGSVLSYGEVARRAGLPGRARWVGTILRQADTGGLPWHRVLRADGRPGLPEGSSGWQEQCRRLQEEGIELRQGKVAGSAFQRGPEDLDAALWDFGNKQG